MYDLKFSDYVMFFFVGKDYNQRRNQLGEEYG